MEFVRGTQTRYGQSGNLGGIPPEYVAKSYEMTCFGEPESLVDDFMRDTLRDNTCVPPSFESEMPRYNNGASNLLNVLHNGQRSLVRPDMPEIYIANTERDPRGCQTMPDMRRTVTAQETRIRRYKDFRSTATSDMGVTEGAYTEPAILADKRSTWPRLKALSNWFDRSLTAEMPGMAVSRNTRSSAQQYFDSDQDHNHPLTEIETPLFTPGEVVLGRGHKPVIVGPRHVPTHVFGVARFGSAPKSAVTRYDASANQWKADPTIRFQKSEERTLRTLARVMASEAGCRAAVANPDVTSFAASDEGMADRRRGEHANVRKALDTGMGSQALIEAIAASVATKRARAPTINDVSACKLHALIDDDIYDASTSANGPTFYLLDDPFTRAARNRNQMTELDVDPSMETPSFSLAHLPTLAEIQRARNSSIIDPDVEESASVYRGQTNVKPTRADDIVRNFRDIDETQYTDFAVAEHLIGPIGDKSRIRAHLRFEPRGGLADINSENRGPFTKRPGSSVSRSLTMSENEPDFAPINRDFDSVRI